MRPLLTRFTFFFLDLLKQKLDGIKREQIWLNVAFRKILENFRGNVDDESVFLAKTTLNSFESSSKQAPLPIKNEVFQ